MKIIKTIKRIIDLYKADKDERCYIVPRKVGDDVWIINSWCMSCDECKHPYDYDDACIACEESRNTPVKWTIQNPVDATECMLDWGKEVFPTEEAAQNYINNCK